MSDLIDRQAALDALRRCQTYLYDARDPELKIKLSSAKAAINNLSTIQPEKAQLSQEGTTKGTTSDLISRQEAIDAVDSETVSTNPEHFKSSEKFIKFMDDDDIASFGRWQWANGFNTALVASKVQLEKLPSAQPEPQEGEWINTNPEYKNGFYNNSYYCSECHDYYTTSPYEMKFCPNCGAKMTISTK